MFTAEEKALFGIIAGGISLLISIIAARRAGKVASTVDRTIDDLSRHDYSSDIAREFVEKAATKSVERHVSNIIDGVAKSARKDARKAFDERIEREINAQYQDTRALVKDELRKKAGAIDISDAKREIISEGKRLAADEFREALADVVGDFRKRFNDTSEIYSAFANMFRKP